MGPCLARVEARWRPGGDGREVCLYLGVRGRG